MKILASIVLVLFTYHLCVCKASDVSVFSPPSDCRALHRRYNYIFKHGNRNSASHLWFSHLLELSEQMTYSEFLELNKCFCAVSGSPVRPSMYNRYGLLLDYLPGKSNGAAESSSSALATTKSTPKKVFGFLHYCCWPCVCDTLDFIKVDTLTVKFKNGVEKQLTVSVIGDPCKGPNVRNEQDLLNIEVPDSFGYRRGGISTVGTTAPEIRCSESYDGSLKLQGAQFSDGGHPIISLLFDPIFGEEEEENETRGHDGRIRNYDDSVNEMSVVSFAGGEPEPGRMSLDPNGVGYQHFKEFSNLCKERIVDGVATSGMGDIFRVLGNITKI